MPGAEHILRFPATLAAYEKAFVELRCALEVRAVQEKARYNVELIFEEIVTNIICHGCGHGTHGTIEVSLGFDDGAIVMKFCDNGPAFDPREHQVADMSSIEDARIGGLGIELVRRACAGIDYQRTPQEENHLTVTVAAR
jgi:serine/threonine-protein kinase RsbW